MKFSKSKLYLFLLLAGIILFLGISFEGSDDIYDRINRNLEMFGKAYREVSLNYVDEIDIDRFMRAGVEGMMSTLDPYTVFYDKTNKDEIDLITTGKYGGIGVTIGLRDSLIIITDIMNGYEAQKKGLRKGDRILNINGITVAGQRIEAIRMMVRGTVGSTLNLQVQRENETLSFELTRQEIILNNISYYGFIGDEADGIAYIKLDRFTNIAENEFENAIRTLKAKNKINSLIFDLRNNGGGLLESSIGILNKLVAKNSLLLITKGRKKDSEIKYFSKEEPLIDKSVPLVVLVNKHTASASEIVAGAIQDLDRGVILGGKTFGKGLVQQVRELTNDAKLKITLSRYFTPSGRWIQEKNYFKENKFGVFINKEIFSQSEFKTLNGRKVMAFGGIAPDVEVNTEPESEILDALIAKDVLFKFGNYYLEKNPGTKIFVCTEGIFNEFKDFLKSSGFLYKSETGKKFDEIKKSLEGKNAPSDFFLYLNKAVTELENYESGDIDKAKEEIMRNLEEEINKRLVSEKEQIETAFPRDIQLQKALNLLKNSSEYYRILQVL